MLTINEKLFLLALDEERGNILAHAKKIIGYVLAGGILAELSLLGKITSNDKRRIEVIDPSLTGDPVLDETLLEIQASEKLRKPAYWVSTISTRAKGLRELVAFRLMEKGWLYQEDKRFFLQQSSDESSQKIPKKYEMKNHLRGLIFSNDQPDHQDLALLNVLSAGGLLNLVFTLDELNYVENKIHERTVQAALDHPALQLIEEIEQAVETSIEEDLD
jgi:hypothetical protein